MKESIGGFLAKPSAKIEDGLLEIKGIINPKRHASPTVSVPLSAVSEVVVQKTSFSEGDLILFGQGSELGRVSGGIVQANKVADWVRQRIG